MRLNRRRQPDLFEGPPNQPPNSEPSSSGDGRESASAPDGGAVERGVDTDPEGGAP